MAAVVRIVELIGAVADGDELCQGIEGRRTVMDGVVNHVVRQQAIRSVDGVAVDIRQPDLALLNRTGFGPGLLVVSDGGGVAVLIGDGDAGKAEAAAALPVQFKAAVVVTGC